MKRKVPEMEGEFSEKEFKKPKNQNEENMDDNINTRERIKRHKIITTTEEGTPRMRREGKLTHTLVEPVIATIKPPTVDKEEEESPKKEEEEEEDVTSTTDASDSIEEEEMNPEDASKHLRTSKKRKTRTSSEKKLSEKKALLTLEVQTTRRTEHMNELEDELSIQLDYDSETGNVKCLECGKEVNYNSIMKHIFGKNAIKKTMEEFRSYANTLSHETPEQKRENYVTYMKDTTRTCKHLTIVSGGDTTSHSPSTSPTRLSPSSKTLAKRIKLLPNARVLSEKKTCISLSKSSPVIYINGITIVLLEDSLILMIKNIPNPKSTMSSEFIDLMHHEITKHGSIRIRHRLTDIPSQELFRTLEESHFIDNMSKDAQEQLCKSLYLETARGFVIKPPRPIDHSEDIPCSPSMFTIHGSEWTAYKYPMVK
jgi:hypothetical protein